MRDKGDQDEKSGERQELGSVFENIHRSARIE